MGSSLRPDLPGCTVSTVVPHGGVRDSEGLEVKGERRGSVEWCWGGWIFFGGGGGWILEQCFDVERIVQCFGFFFNLKMPGLGWSDEFGLGEGSRLSLAVRTTASGV